MISSLALSRIFAFSVDVLKRKTLGRHVLRSLSIDNHNYLSPFSNSLNRSMPVRCTCVTHPSRLVSKAMKHTGSKFSRGKDGKKVKEEDEDDEEDSKDISGLDPGVLSDVDGKDVKIIKTRLNSLRLDSLLKAGLGTAKNKVDTAFYESKIRVNGEKVLKKSKRLEIGDEVDLIKGSNVVNPTFLDVARVIILVVDQSPDLEKVSVVLKRYRLLTIQNYSTSPYKIGASSE